MLENDSQMMPNDTKQHETMPPNNIHFARFKRLQIPAGRAPLLLNAAVAAAASEAVAIAANGEAAPREQTTNEQSIEPQLNLKGVRRLGSRQTLAAAGVVFTPSPRCERCRATTGLRQTETRCPRCRLALRLDELIGASNLSPEVWERIRRICCLPKAAEKMSLDQSRAAFQVLNLFVSRVSFSEQIELSDGDLNARLLALPDLPPVFIKLVRRRIETAEQGNVAKNGEDNTGKKITGSNATPLEKNNLDAPSAKRQPISAARFTEVAVRQGCYCYWCGIRVVREAEIPQANRLTRNHSTIVYLSASGELREETLGTIDHLVRVTDGGDNSLANLVISCRACNLERDQVTMAYGRPFAKQRVSCSNCGGRFHHPGWGCCSICGTPPESAKKRPNGEDRIGKLFALIGRAKKQLLRKFGLSK